MQKLNFDSDQDVDKIHLYNISLSDSQLLSLSQLKQAQPSDIRLFLC